MAVASSSQAPGELTTARRRGRGPELDLISATLAWPRDAQARQRLHEASRGAIDWSLVVRLAERHRVAALAAYALEDAVVDVPQEVRESFRRRGMEVACEELGMAAELTRLEAAFAERNCRFTVLKGVAAALQGFGRIGLRQNRDIDLLVAERDLAGAITSLEAMNYVQVEPAEKLSAAALRDWARSHKDLVFRKPDGLVVEVHWRLFDNPLYAEALSNLPTVELTLPSGVQIRALTSEAAFAYMAAHGAQHAWSRLKWLADFAAYARGFGSARTEELYAELTARGLGGPIGQGLILSHELTGLPLPPALASALKRSPRLQLLRAFGLSAIGDHEALELEDRAFGSTLKTLSHYLLSGRLGYLIEQATLDAGEVPKAHASPWLRRMGILAKAPIWVGARIGRLARSRRRHSQKR